MAYGDRHAPSVPGTRAATPATGTAAPPGVSTAGFVGRGDERRALVEALATTPAVAVVAGESGIGKTRLVAELLADPAMVDRRRVVGACRRIGDPFPLGPVVQGLAPHGEALAGATLSPVAGALRPLLPELSHVLPEPPPPLDDRLADRHRLFRGLVEVLGALGPVLLVVEDLHWADDQTLEFLGHLTTDPPPGLALVMTFRDGETDASARLVATSVPSDVAQVHLDLAPLDLDETRVLAARFLEFDGLSSEFVAYLWERTSGLPLAVEELLALMQSRGTLVRHGSGWVRRALDELDVPRRIRDAVLERVGRMSVPARAVLETAAVLQVPQPLDVLVATSGRNDDEVLAGLDEGLDERLLVDGDAGVRFRHVLAAQAVYESIPATRRRQLHGRAAEALEPRAGHLLGQVAHHLRRAGGAEVWALAAERAADKAIELRHDGEAARLLEDLLRNAPLPPADRGRVALKLARAARDSVSADQGVTSLLMEVLEGDVPPGVRGELRFLVGVLLDRHGGDPATRRDLYARAVEELAHRLDLQAWAMVGLGIPTVPGVPASELRAWLHRALEIVPAVDDPGARVFLWAKAAMVLVSMGDPAWTTLVDRVRRETGDEPVTRRAVKAYDSVGIEACYSGHHRTADTLLRAGLRGAAVCDSRMLELRLLRSSALLDYCTGRWDGLRERVRDLAGELSELPHVRAAVDAVAGCLALAGGDLDDARDRLERVTEDVSDVGAYVLLPVPTVALMRLLVARDEQDEAVRVGLAVLDGAVSYGLVAPAVRLLPTLTEAMVASRRLDDAEASVARMSALVRGLDAPLAPATTAHARGHLAAAAGDCVAAARHFTAAADAYDSLACRYEAAHAGEHAAQSLVRAGDAGAGQDRLGGVLAAYRSLGASWDQARATRTARGWGMTVPGRHRGGRRGYGEELSPREREVAGLVAIGLSNEEIGRELYLSPKTVEKHVSAARRKLGATSRAAVAHRLAASPAP
ncbi:LuxR family transcriptional regulator [Isoptericola hypogeus]|uniref:LuxR family transcriptional regulator n=1 Tax=Isoptericola hypogeus TaxID=300179 RepID=A0ABN2JS77_9MICO